MRAVLTHRRLLVSILFLFLCYSWQSFSEEQSNNSYYEICNWQNKQYTENMINQAKQFKFTEASSSCTEAYCWDELKYFLFDHDSKWFQGNERSCFF